VEFFGSLVTNALLTIFLTIAWCGNWKAEARKNLYKAFLGVFIFNYVVSGIALSMMWQVAILPGLGKCPIGYELFCTLGAPPSVVAAAASVIGPAVIYITFIFCCCCLGPICTISTFCNIWVLGIFGSFYNESVREANEAGDDNDVEMKPLKNGNRVMQDFD
jgi:hypothetical protein